MRNDARYSKFNQENIFNLKRQWKGYGDILFNHFEKILLIT